MRTTWTLLGETGKDKYKAEIFEVANGGGDNIKSPIFIKKIKHENNYIHHYCAPHRILCR